MENENTKRIEELAEQIINSNIDETPTVEELQEAEIPNEVVEELKEALAQPNNATDTRAVENEAPQSQNPQPQTTQKSQNPQNTQVQSVEEKEKMLPQSQVNEIVAKARKEGRESAMKEILARYGVTSEDDFNAIYDKGTRYDMLNDEYLGQSKSYKEVIADNALLKSKFDSGKYDSVKAILRGKGLDITPENIDAIFPEFPEWHRKVQVTPQYVAEATQTHATQERTPQPTTLRKLGNEVKVNTGEEDSEYNRAMKLYGFNRKGGK